MIFPNQETNAHRLVRDLCLEMANAVYEELATLHNNFVKMNPDRRAYVNRIAPSLVAEARHTLAALLDDSHHLPDTDKQTIFDALLLDSTIPQAKQRGVYKLPLLPN